MPLRPLDAADALRERLGEILDGPVTFSNVQRHPEGGYTFDYTDGQTSGAGFAKRRHGEWFLAPKSVTEAQLEQVRAGWQAEFDDRWVETLRDDWDASASEIADMRDALQPTGAFFPGESDPYDDVSDYPLVFDVHNPTGSDHGFFAGFNPDTGEVDAYDFN